MTAVLERAYPRTRATSLPPVGLPPGRREAGALVQRVLDRDPEAIDALVDVVDAAVGLAYMAPADDHRIAYAEPLADLRDALQAAGCRRWQVGR